MSIKTPFHSYISAMLLTTNAYGMYQRYMRQLASPRFKAIGFEPREGATESPTIIYSRSYLVGMMCGANDEDCLEKARIALRRWKEDGKLPLRLAIAWMSKGLTLKKFIMLLNS